MKIKKYKINKVTQAVVAALLPIVLSSSFNVLAADYSEDKSVEPEKEIEVIDVVGTRASLTSSLKNKRFADSVMDSITADDIGSFPDNNVAESLQRIPGISITRSLSGQGEQISIRGFSAGKNVTLVNGQQMVSSGFQLENSLNRGFNFGMLPAEIVQRTEVYKSSEARLVEGGVGGTVNIVTRKPLNLKDKTLFKVSGAGSYNTLSEETSPIFSSLASWRTDDENFGVLASLDYFEADARRDAAEVFQYRTYDVTTQSDGKTYPKAIVPVIAGASSFNQELKRTTAMVTLQYKPIDTIDMSLSVLDSSLKGDNLNIALFSKNHLANHATDVERGVYDENTNTFTEIEYNQTSKGDKNPGWIPAIARESELQNTAINFDLVWTGENTQVTFAAGASESSGGPGRVNIARILIPGTSIVDISDGVGNVQYGDNDVSDLSNFEAGNFLFNQLRTTDTDSQFFAVDADYEFDGENIVQSLNFGVRHTATNVENRMFAHKITNYNELVPNGVTASEVGTLYNVHSNLLNDINNNALTNFQYLNPLEVRQYFDDKGAQYQAGVHTGNTWDLEEEVTSLYVQANFLHDFDNFTVRGNAGLRYVEQDVLTRNYAGGGPWIDNITSYSPEFNDSRTGNTSNTLPSLNIVLDLENDVVIRTAYSTVISRPEYAELAQKLSASRDDETNGSLTANKGNADLEAFEADKYDVSAEWYYKEGSSISLGVFYYDVKTFVVKDTVSEDLFNDGREWAVTQPINIDGGSLEGLEFSLIHQFDTLPAPFDGLGIQANYTKIDTESAQQDAEGKDLPLPGLSDETYNAVLFYSKEAWDARISYNYRSGYYEQSVFNLPRYNDSIARLDMKVKYNVNEKLGVYLQATNLTNEENFRYFGEESRPFQHSVVGSNYVAGFNYTF